MSNWENLQNLPRSEQIQSIQELLQDLSILDYRDHNDNNLLLIASTNCDESTVKQIVDAGLDINDTNYFGDSALMVAALSNSRIVQTLIELGADVNLRSWDGYTALHLAALKGDPNVVQLLLDSSANLNALDDFGRSALHMAVNFDNVEVTQLLIERGIKIDLCKDSSDTALSIAVKKCNQKMVRLLLDAGARNIRYVSNNGRTMLHEVLCMENEEIVRDIINRGANVNAKDVDGFTPLHEAVTCRNVPQIIVLLKNGASIEAKTVEGNTPLHWAIIHETPRMSRGIMQVLLTKGADINEPNFDGSTPFHFILRNGTIEDIQMFLLYNTSIIMQNCFGENILHWAAANENPDVIKLLLQCKTHLPIDGTCAFGLTALHVAARSGRASTIYVLVATGANVNKMDVNKKTPIYFAALKAEKMAVKALLDLGADVNQGNQMCEMILYVALQRKSRIITHLLVEHLANLNAKGIRLNKHNVSLIEKNEELKIHYEKCTIELQRMKNYKIYNNVSYFKILNSNVDVIAGYSRNDNITKIFMCNNYGNDFPIYKLALKTKIHEGLTRSTFLEAAANLLSHALPFLNKNHVVIQTIVRYLRKDDIPDLLVK